MIRRPPCSNDEVLLSMVLLPYHIVYHDRFQRFLYLSWNIRGTASGAAKRHLRDYISQYKPSNVLLMETRVQFSRVKRFWDRLGYSVICIEEVRGHAGGIWWLSSCSDVNISVVDSCEQAITCKLSKGNSVWW